MRIFTALLAAAALTCASRPTAFVFGEGAVLNKVDTLTIKQPGCRVEIHATGDGGTVHDAVLDNDLSWTDDSVSTSWSPKKMGSAILAGCSRSSPTSSTTP